MTAEVKIAIGEEVVVERVDRLKRDPPGRIDKIARVTPTQFVVGARHFLRSTLREVTASLSQRCRVRAVTAEDRAAARHAKLLDRLDRCVLKTWQTTALESIAAELGLPPDDGRRYERTMDIELDRLRFRAAARLRMADLDVGAEHLLLDDPFAAAALRAMSAFTRSISAASASASRATSRMLCNGSPSAPILILHAMMRSIASARHRGSPA